MSTYTVVAKRWARGWELYISDEAGNEVGATQSHTIGGAEPMVRDYLSLVFDADPDSFDVTIRPELDAEDSGELAEVRKLREEADRAQEAAAERVRAFARRLKAQGYRGVDIAKVLGVSTQRVSQLVKS